ncbi:MAG: DUF4168 domain-containing protein [Coleofasciculus sp. A1-SPW-01]|uniref:DUF4168 domain-containing protein n=1 Tax=Coleofasciculus TaxID=669368 RepID=UPI0005C69E68|nr:DUF4168 domain-containing protein [Coleofasciculus chthonoplastes]
MITSYCNHPHVPRFSRPLIVAALTSLGLLSGFIPELSRQSLSLDFSRAVYAQQAVTEAEVTNYARAVLAMEPLRQVAYNEIKKIVNGNIPDIQCHRSETINQLPSQEARKIANTYCNQALALVNNYLTPSRFNQITRLAEKDGNLRQRIQDALQRQQESSQR